MKTGTEAGMLLEMYKMGLLPYILLHCWKKDGVNNEGADRTLDRLRIREDAIIGLWIMFIWTSLISCASLVVFSYTGVSKELLRIVGVGALLFMLILFCLIIWKSKPTALFSDLKELREVLRIKWVELLAINGRLELVLYSDKALARLAALNLDANNKRGPYSEEAEKALAAFRYGHGVCRRFSMGDKKWDRHYKDGETYKLEAHEILLEKRPKLDAGGMSTLLG